MQILNKKSTEFKAKQATKLAADNLMLIYIIVEFTKLIYIRNTD